MDLLVFKLVMGTGLTLVNISFTTTFVTFNHKPSHKFRHSDTYDLMHIRKQWHNVCSL
jgi:hypothetical protein